MKSELRVKYKSKRIALSGEEVFKKSKNIIENLNYIPEFVYANIILLYIPIQNEVDTWPLIKTLLEKNKKVIVPITDLISHNLILSELTDLDHLEKSKLGVMEPKKEYQKIIKPEEIDLCLIPGIVFDRSGARIGFGKGYYDKLLSTISAKRMGLAYSFQVINHIKTEKHDIPMDLIVTEDEIIRIQN